MSVAVSLEGTRCGSRKAERFPVGGSVSARYCREKLLVLVHDMSISGMRIETQEVMLRSSDWLRVRLPVLDKDQLVQVIWADGLTAGVIFAEPLGAAVLPTIIEVLLPDLDKSR